MCHCEVVLMYMLMKVLVVSFLFINVALSLNEKEFTGDSGVIQSDSKDGRYLNNVTIKYNIKVPNGKRVKLSFKAFSVLGSMPGCDEDSLEIFIGCNEQSLGKFCSCGLYGESKLFDIYSKDECISVLFKTDAKHVGTGFKANYSSSDKTTSVSTMKSCSLLNINQEAEGNFFTPLWPNKYSSDFSCTWTASIPDGYNAMIYFMNFHIEQNIVCSQQSAIDDYVRITASTGSKNETVRQRLCSQGVDKTFSIAVNNYRKVYVTFVSDSDNTTESGFAAGFISYKSGISVGNCSDDKSPTQPPSESLVPLSTEPSTLLVAILVLVNFLLLSGYK